MRVVGSVLGELAVDAAPQVVGVAVGDRAGEQRLRHVLVGDGPQEAFDGAGADGGAAGVGGGGRRAAVDHRVADLDAGGPAVEEDAAGLAFEDRQELCGVVVVGLVGVDGRGELAFDVLGDRLHVGGVLAADDEAGGAEDLRLQALGLEEGGGVGGEQGGAAGGLVLAGLAAADEVGFLAQGGDTSA